MPRSATRLLRETRIIMLGSLLILAAMLVLACVMVAVVFILDRATPSEPHPDTDKIDWPPQ
jgi:hypothetical protein